MLKEFIDRFKSKSEADATPETKADETPAEPVFNTERMKAIISELNNADSLFKESGFIMEKLDVSVGSESKVTPHFKQFSATSEDEQNAILGRISDSSIIKFVLMSLFRSSKMGGLFDSTEMYFHQVSIDISTTPTVTTSFKREHSSEDSFEVIKH